MPLDEIASGCLQLIGRLLFEFVVDGILRGIWSWCQTVGEFAMRLAAFGRARVDMRYEITSGIMGLLLHAVPIYLVIRWALK
jgi:hypothetical protein